MQKKITKIVLTGGHAVTTAISLVEEIKRRKKDVDLYWIGTKRAIEGKSFQTATSQLLPSLGVYHYSIVSGRLQKKWTIWTIPSILKIPISFIQAFYLIVKIRPSIIISFGGHAGFPVVVAGWLMRVPVVIHEQTSAVGLANKLSAFFARNIAISRSESRKYFPGKKVILMGNLVLPKVSKVAHKVKIGSPPLIYITCGATGAHRVNEIVDKILEVVLSDFKIIHQTGDLDYSYFVERRRSLDGQLQSRYEVHNYINPLEVDKTFEKADLIISRAGANTVSDILAIARPSLLIPIPWSSYDEQMKNALLVEKAGIGIILTESELTPESLLSKIFSLRDNWGKMVRSVDSRLARLDAGASRKLVNLIENLVK
jgi:UDP-N-acetylglucosamine--N-acetylmuramyl-(pentapeptide) pyrophosphoryl-undecaprenol N-acetylglucosamine transferase